MTDVAALIVTEHVGVMPEQAPPQPVKVAPVAGVAVNTTSGGELKLALQFVAPLPQVMPAGLLLTTPLPLVLTVNP